MADMDRQLRETLRRIVDENGTGVLLENDGRRAVAFAADYLPYAKKERKLLKIVLDTGIAGKIHSDVAVRKQDPLLCRKKYVMRIREDLSMEREAAEFIVDCIFYAFGLDGRQSLSDHSQGAGDRKAVEKTPASGDRWDDDEDSVSGDRWGDEEDSASGDRWDDEEDAASGDRWGDEENPASGDRWGDEKDPASGDYQADEDYRMEGGRISAGRKSRRQNHRRKEKREKGITGGLIAAGILVILGFLMWLYHYGITRFFIYSLEFGRFIQGWKLERYLMSLGKGLIAAGVILAAVCVAGFLRKRRKK